MTWDPNTGQYSSDLPSSRTLKDGIPRDGWGNQVSDVKFLVSLLDYYIKASGEPLEPEDEAVIRRIKG